MNNLTTPAPTIERDHYGRPKVIPPNQGADAKKVSYTRCTTFVSVLEDRYNLEKWLQRMVATGLAQRPDLVLAAAAAQDNKGKLNRLCDDAIEAAKGKAAATTGTALHTFTEMLDRGLDLPALPPDTGRDIAAYQQATAGLDWVGIEQFVVNDPLQVGGTPDRIVNIDGTRHIADLKTGNIGYGRLKIAMQLAMYARSTAYDPANGDRDPLDVDVDKALVIHLPQGQATCTLHWVDIAAGWSAVKVASEVRGWRTRDRKGDLIGDPINFAVADPIGDAIVDADTVAVLEQIWRDNQLSWTDVHTASAAVRRQELAAVETSTAA